MIIRDKIVYVYDIEVFPNVFHCTVKNTETSELHKFEISCRRNQLDELVEFFHTVNTKYTFGDLYTTDIKLDTNILFCGYNNLHYDNAIINYIIDCYNIMKYKGYRDICRSVFNLSKVITTSSEDDNSAWRKWKYMICFDSFDILTMLYSNKLRVGLKEIQVTMQYKNVQEFVADWQADLPENQIDSMIDYNINDVNSTEELLNRCKKDIDLRIAIEDEYGVRVLSKDGVNIGMKILTQKYLEKTGQTWWDIKDLRSPMSVIPLNSVILPFIKYDSPILTRVLNDMKSQIVSPGRKGYENKFVFEGLQYSVGVGGIHSVNKPEIIIPKEDEMLIDIDVASLYPSMLIEYEFYPKHLGPEFLEVYKQIKDERIEAKHNGNKVKNETLKLALNGLSGNLQNEHNFCYSPFAVMQIRINGQLLLLMLAEKLTQLGCRIVQANTDGLFVLLKKDVYSKVNNVCREWEQLTKLTLEEERFKAMYQYAINDYFAITEDDKVKEKGMFITTVKLGKGLTPKIVPKAVINFFKNGVSVEETIKGCQDIRDFLMSEKTGKQWHVEYNNKEQQRTNRFYASTNGAYLWKWKPTGYKEGEIVEYDVPYVGTQRYTAKERQYQNMLTASGVTLLNYLDDKPIEERKINYRYYIMEAYKIIRELKPLQMSLWD
jgi:hypothetical protein